MRRMLLLLLLHARVDGRPGPHQRVPVQAGQCLARQAALAERQIAQDHIHDTRADRAPRGIRRQQIVRRRRCSRARGSPIANRMALAIDLAFLSASVLRPPSLRSGSQVCGRCCQHVRHRRSVPPQHQRAVWSELGRLHKDRPPPLHRGVTFLSFLARTAPT
jgi:hypothetical protein